MDVNKKIDEIMPDSANIDELKNSISKMLLEIIPFLIWHILIFTWIYIGIIHSEESRYFLGILFVIIFDKIMVSVMKHIANNRTADDLPNIGEFALNPKEEMKRVFNKEQDPNQVKFWIVMRIVKSIIIAIILYHHFFIS